MSTPATAGRIIEEEELRAYTKCSQLFHYGGRVDLPLLTKIVKNTVELLIVEAIRDERILTKDFAGTLRRIFSLLKIKDQMSDGEADKLFRSAVYALDRILESLRNLELVGISGPFEQRLQISKTPINLRFSGLMRKQKTQELIIPVFMPSLGDHAVLNDPALQLKINQIKRFGKTHNKRPTVSAYVYTIKQDGTVGFYYLSDKEQDPTRIQMIENQIKAMEIGYHYPIIPCQYSCPFKSKCFPGGK